MKTLTLNGRTLGELTILTEKTHYGINECTMENARAANEEPYFGQTGAGNEVATTRTDILTIPRQTTGGDWQSNTSISVSKLGALTHKSGSNVNASFSRQH